MELFGGECAFFVINPHMAVKSILYFDIVFVNYSPPEKQMAAFPTCVFPLLTKVRAEKKRNEIGG